VCKGPKMLMQWMGLTHQTKLLCKSSVMLSAECPDNDRQSHGSHNNAYRSPVEACNSKQLKVASVLGYKMSVEPRILVT
jgi:hypothetical protein